MTRLTKDSASNLAELKKVVANLSEYLNDRDPVEVLCDCEIELHDDELTDGSVVMNLRIYGVGAF